MLTVLYHQARGELGFRAIARRDGVMLHFDELPAEAVPAAVAVLRGYPELRRVRWRWRHRVTGTPDLRPMSPERTSHDDARDAGPQSSPGADEQPGD